MRTRLDVLLARNRAMGSPLDDASTTLDGATGELVGCEALMRLAFSMIGAGEFMARFSAAVPLAQEAVERAEVAMSQREQRVAGGLATQLTGLMERLGVLELQNRTAGSPEDDASNAIADAGVAVRQAQALSSATGSGPGDARLAAAVARAKAAVDGAAAALRMRAQRSVNKFKAEANARAARAASVLARARAKLDGVQSRVGVGRDDGASRTGNEAVAEAIEVALGDVATATSLQQVLERSPDDDALVNQFVDAAEAAEKSTLAAAKAMQARENARRHAERAELAAQVAAEASKAEAWRVELQALRDTARGLPSVSSDALDDVFWRAGGAIATFEALEAQLRGNPDNLQLARQFIGTVPDVVRAMGEAREAVARAQKQSRFAERSRLEDTMKRLGTSVAEMVARLVPARVTMDDIVRRANSLSATIALPLELNRFIENATILLVSAEALRRIVEQTPSALVAEQFFAASVPALAAVDDAVHAMDECGSRVAAEAERRFIEARERLSEARMANRLDGTPADEATASLERAGVLFAGVEVKRKAEGGRVDFAGSADYNASATAAVDAVVDSARQIEARTAGRRAKMRAADATKVAKASAMMSVAHAKLLQMQKKMADDGLGRKLEAVADAIEQANADASAADHLSALVNAAPESTEMVDAYFEAASRASETVGAAAKVLQDGHAALRRREREDLDAQVAAGIAAVDQTKVDLKAINRRLEELRASDGELDARIAALVGDIARADALIPQITGPHGSSAIAGKFLAVVPDIQRGVADALVLLKRVEQAKERERRDEEARRLAMNRRRGDDVQAAMAALAPLTRQVADLTRRQKACGGPDDEAAEALTNASGAVSNAEAAKRLMTDNTDSLDMVDNFVESVAAAVSAMREAIVVFETRDKRLIETADTQLTEAKEKVMLASGINRAAGEPDDRATRLLRRAQELVEESKQQRVNDPTGRFPTTAGPALEAASQALDAVKERDNAAMRARVAAAASRAAKAAGSLSIARGKLAQLQARNREDGSPDDEASEDIDAAANSVSGAESLRPLIAEHPDSVDIAEKFAVSVDRATELVGRAGKSVAARAASRRDEEKSKLAAQCSSAAAQLESVRASMRSIQLRVDELTAADRPVPDVEAKLRETWDQVAVCDSFLGQMKSQPHSTELAKSFIRAVPLAQVLVSAAADLLSAAESALKADTSRRALDRQALLAELAAARSKLKPAKALLASLMTRNRTMRSPDDDASRALDNASTNVSGAETLLLLLGKNPDSVDLCRQFVFAVPNAIAAVEAARDKMKAREDRLLEDADAELRGLATQIQQMGAAAGAARHDDPVVVAVADASRMSEQMRGIRRTEPMKFILQIDPLRVAVERAQAMLKRRAEELARAGQAKLDAMAAELAVSKTRLESLRAQVKGVGEGSEGEDEIDEAQSLVATAESLKAMCTNPGNSELLRKFTDSGEKAIAAVERVSQALMARAEAAKLKKESDAAAAAAAALADLNACRSGYSALKSKCGDACERNAALANKVARTDTAMQRAEQLADALSDRRPEFKAVELFVAAVPVLQAALSDAQDELARWKEQQLAEAAAARRKQEERTAVLVQNAARDLEAARPIVEALQARNRGGGVDDDASRRIVHAASAMVSCDVLLNLLRGSPNSLELAEQFVSAVPPAVQAVKDAKAAVDARERAMSDEIDRKLSAAKEKLARLEGTVKAAAAGTETLDEVVLSTVDEAADAVRELEALRLEPGSTLKAYQRVDKVVAKVDAAEQALTDARTMKLRKRRASRTAHAAVARSNLDVAEQKLSALMARNAKGGYPDDDDVAADIEAAKSALAEARSLAAVIDAAMPEPPLETTEKFVVKAARAMDAVQKAIKSFNAREQARRDAEKADLQGRVAAGAAVIAAAQASLKSAAAKLAALPSAPRISALLDDAGASLTVVDNKRLRAIAGEGPMLACARLIVHACACCEP